LLTLTARDVGFSYEWLVHIGASTKRDNGGVHVGYFGEGFKMAVLCISNFHDHEVFQSVLLGFCYPENPLLGEEIWRSEKGVAYKRSRLRKPPEYPETSRFEGPGIIFASFQARGSIPVPLIFCLHNYRDNDRDRDVFYRMDAMSLISIVVTHMTAPAAAGGFTDPRPPRGDEIVRLEFLGRCVGALIPELGERGLPDVRVFDDCATAFWGLAACKPAPRPFERLLGFPVRYVLSEISVNATLLRSGDFAEILSTCLHEVAHMFGRDESSAFSRVLTFLIEVTIRERETIARFQEEWLLITGVPDDGVNSYREFCGVWSDAETAEFAANAADTRRIDLEDWQE
jgi:hypothetical protein